MEYFFTICHKKKKKIGMKLIFNFENEQMFIFHNININSSLIL